MRTRLFRSSSDPVPSRLEVQGEHRSVLLRETIDALALKPDDIVVDATLGRGGHALRIAERLGPRGIFIGFDADEDAARHAEKVLEGVPPRIFIRNANFRNLAADLADLGITRITKAVFDLGWNTTQLAAGRGFSFQADEPLLMTYAKRPGPGSLTAGDIVNGWSEESLANVFFGYGEERYARRIARRIVEERGKLPIQTARELAEVIRRAVPAAYARGRIHPATRSFQALRIAVNDELGALREGIGDALRLLAEHGRIAVISFHSTEDREVKKIFAEAEKSGVCKRVFKKPVTPGAEECAENPRARSAKLRVVEKTI